MASRWLAASLTGLALIVALLEVMSAPASAPAMSTTRSPGVRLHAPTKVLVFVEENHSLEAMRRGMPFLFKLAKRYAYATGWSALTHPSLPNYLGIAGGSMFGVTDNGSPSKNARKIGRAESVFDQALRQGRTAKVYLESMRRNCQTTSSPSGQFGRYVVKHNFWPYFASSGARPHCRRHDVPAGGLHGGALMRDVARGTLPNLGMVVPNLSNDAHNGSLIRADRWLRARLPRILASRAFTSGRLVVVVTADEGHGTRHNKVLTAVLHRSLSHRVVRRPLTHYSLCRYLSQVVGARPLRRAARAPDMGRAFGLRHQ